MDAALRDRRSCPTMRGREKHYGADSCQRRSGEQEMDENEMAVGMLDVGRPDEMAMLNPSSYLKNVEAGLVNAFDLIIVTVELQAAASALRQEARAYAATASDILRRDKASLAEARARLDSKFDELVSLIRQAKKSPKAIALGV
jgi:hypothetical protein